MITRELPEREPCGYDDLEAHVAWWIRYAHSTGQRLLRISLDRETARRARQHPEWMFGIPWTEDAASGVNTFFMGDAEGA